MKMAISKYFFIRFLNFSLCFAGVVVSIYAYYVEFNKERDPMFRAMCDINAWVSCSKVFTSRWGRGFGLLGYIVGDKSIINQPNSVFGLTFYAMQMILGENHTVSGATVQIAFSVLANMGCMYLAYILYFVLQDFCIVCVTTYIINAALLFINTLKYSYMVAKRQKATNRKDR